jgi:hypothetical protein
LSFSSVVHERVGLHVRALNMRSRRSILEPSTRDCQPKTMSNTASAFDARCHAYVDGQTSTLQSTQAQMSARAVGSAALHKGNLGLDGVRVLGLHLRLPPLNCLVCGSHDRAATNEARERASRSEAHSRLYNLSPLNATRLCSLRRLLTAFCVPHWFITSFLALE